MVLLIMVLVSASLLKSANMIVSKLLCSSFSVISFSAFIAYVTNLMFSLPILFLKIIAFVSTCLSSRP